MSDSESSDDMPMLKSPETSDDEEIYLAQQAANIQAIPVHVPGDDPGPIPEEDMLPTLDFIHGSPMCISVIVFHLALTATTLKVRA